MDTNQSNPNSKAHAANDASGAHISITDSSLPTVGALSLPQYYYPTNSVETSSSTAVATTSHNTPVAAPSLSPKDIMISKRRKELFGDCALIEIIHLHDCLRGALQSLQEDVAALTQQIIQDNHSNHKSANNLVAMSEANTISDDKLENTEASDMAHWGDLEGRVAGRFKVIWSVFRAHSSAEDEFIWPALRSKMQSPASSNNNNAPAAVSVASMVNVIPQELHQEHVHRSPPKNVSTCGCGSGIVQEEYEEDHADEERMFSEMDTLLKQLRDLINEERRKRQSGAPPRLGAVSAHLIKDGEANAMAHKISDRTGVLCDHLMKHLEKEETQCMPLVVKHLSKSEIHDLVGNIMGKRSADTIAQIMTMAVQSLAENERREMIQYMKQSMQNTFFDRWLLASGWGQVEASECNSASTSNDSSSPTNGTDSASTKESQSSTKSEAKEGKPSQTISETPAAIVSTNAARKRPADSELATGVDSKKAVGNVAAAGVPTVTDQTIPGVNDHANPPSHQTHSSPPTNRRSLQITSQAELEKLIRAIASNPALNPQQKNSTIQGLRDSVWKSNQREKQRGNAPDSPPAVPVNAPLPTTEALPLLTQQQARAATSAAAAASSNLNEIQQRRRVGLPPSAYYKKKGGSAIELVWKNDGMPPRTVLSPDDDSVPLFSASELAPTFHDGAAGAVLGCPHYARAVKLRHPKSGRLYTCRLCCDQARELPTFRGGTQDENLDRYAVSEVMCMSCNALQPAEDRCINPDCTSKDKPFAKYFCRICHLYDDGSRPIFHCPYCNTCRLGLGLGIDFRHCMRCNACVSLDDKEHHCIPQKLQGSCPICHDSLFQSTEPLRGLKCGHVMHMKCFTDYRNTSYTCPLCMRSMEDMKDHFALLDAAIRMQPMPASFLHTLSNIFCQDCGKTGQAQYHFVGQKCPHCSSYNTREMGRVHNPPTTT